MQTNLNRNQAQKSSLFQFVKSLFQGKPAQVYRRDTQTIYLTQQDTKKCVTINLNELSAEARSGYDALLANLFSSNHFSKTA